MNIAVLKQWRRLEHGDRPCTRNSAEQQARLARFPRLKRLEKMDEREHCCDDESI